LINKDKILINI